MYLAEGPLIYVCHYVAVSGDDKIGIPRADCVVANLKIMTSGGNILSPVTRAGPEVVPLLGQHHRYIAFIVVPIIFAI